MTRTSLSHTSKLYLIASFGAARIALIHLVTGPTLNLPRRARRLSRLTSTTSSRPKEDVDTERQEYNTQDLNAGRKGGGADKNRR